MRRHDSGAHHSWPRKSHTAIVDHCLYIIWSRGFRLRGVTPGTRSKLIWGQSERRTGICADEKLIIQVHWDLGPQHTQTCDCYTTPFAEPSSGPGRVSRPRTLYCRKAQTLCAYPFSETISNSWWSILSPNPLKEVSMLTKIYHSQASKGVLGALMCCLACHRSCSTSLAKIKERALALSKVCE